MNASLTAVIAFCVMVAAVLLGKGVSRLLPEHHLNPDTKDTVKLAMGMAATMAALLLGLLVNSAKGTYDSERNEVIQMAAKVAFLDRMLELYGPEAAGIRTQLRSVVKDATIQIWRQESSRQAQLFSDTQSGTALNDAIQRLSPQNEEQRSFKTQATTVAFELAQMRSLLLAQSAPTILMPMLTVVVGWFVVIYLSFSVISAPNATATFALMVSAFTLSGAIFLILELDQPFSGLLHISSQPILNALNQMGK